MRFSEFSSQYEPAIRRALDDSLRQVEHATLRAVMGHLLGRGKLYRPLLALAVIRGCGEDEQRFTELAAPLEMIHTFTLIHDDLPCMDDARLRRGVPAAHLAHGEAQAVLGGDALLNFALFCFVDRAEQVGSERFPALLSEVTWATHLVVEGQMMDIALEDADCTLEQLEELHYRKTGALLAACCATGAILAGCDTRQTGRYREFGRRLGLLFQIRDDLLSIDSSDERTGKSLDTDSAQAKSTYPRVLGPDGAREKLAEELHGMQQLVDELQSEEQELLSDIVDYTAGRDH